MATSIKDFLKELYKKYLEEISFLYEQRLSLLDDFELSWLDVDGFDQRIEAHLDGLMIGGDLAVDTCIEQITEGDAGEIHGAFRILCRQDKLDTIKQLLIDLDYEDVEVVRAVSDALKYELPEYRKNDVLMLLDEAIQCAPIIATLVGFRRWKSESHRLRHILSEQTEGLPQIMWALGRLSDTNSKVLLLNQLDNQNLEIRFAAQLALLRLGDKTALQKSIADQTPEEWPFLLMGLGGDQKHVKILNSVAAAGKANPDCLLALGLLGDMSSFSILVNQLENTDLATDAAIALNLITGAELYEDAFIPDEIDEDVLFEEEIEKLKNGENLYLPGQQPGISITRISQNPAIWNQWYANNRTKFKPGVRFRKGKPYSPTTLLENLFSETSPNKIRWLIGEELTIHYDIDFSFEIDQSVTQQKQLITKCNEWARSISSR